MPLFIMKGLLCAMLSVVCMHISPALAETPFESSLRLIANGQITEARRALKSELRMRPHHLEARYNLALLLEDIDHQQDALMLYKENLSIGWHLPSLVNLAALFERQGEIALARSWLERATKQLSDEAAPWYLLAAMAEKEGDKQRARSYYHKATKVDALNGFAWFHLAAFKFRQQSGDYGSKDAAKAMRLLPRCAPCWKTYGDILQVRKKHQQALLAYQQSFAINPTDMTREHMIVTLRSLGEHQRADAMQRIVDIGKP